jgi:PAS domain-containing protein
LVGIVTLNQDITAQKRLEAELVSAKRQLEEAVASMPDGFALIRKDGHPLTCNERFRELMPNVQRVPIHDTFRGSADNRTGVANAPVDPDFQDAGCASLPSDLLRFDGGQEVLLDDGRWLEGKSRRIEDGGTIVCVRDVTEHKRLELAKAKAQIEDALESMADGFVVFDAEDRLEFCNRRCRDIFAGVIDLAGPDIRKLDLIRAAARSDTLAGAGRAGLEAIIEQLASHREGSWD